MAVNSILNNVLAGIAIGTIAKALAKWLQNELERWLADRLPLPRASPIRFVHKDIDHTELTFESPIAYTRLIILLVAMQRSRKDAFEILDSAINVFEETHYDISNKQLDAYDDCFDLDDQIICIACEVHPIDIALVPCYHCVYCRVCAARNYVNLLLQKIGNRQLETCPLCREEVIDWGYFGDSGPGSDFTLERGMAHQDVRDWMDSIRMLS